VITVNEAHFEELRNGIEEVRRATPVIERWADALVHAFAGGNKVLVAGNGGSAALAAHFTGELLGRYRMERLALPAVWLGADQCGSTAIANDYGYEQVFARQVSALCAPGDIVLLLSTSGRSRNVLAAVETARTKQARSWALTGALPNALATACDEQLGFAGSVAVVQELHQIVVHVLCEFIDALVSEGAAP